MNAASGPLVGVKVVELAGLGPGPWCAMLLSDLGAEVIRVDRADAVGSDSPERRAPDFVNRRGRPSIAVDLKSAAGVEVVLRLAERADALIEGYRPGVVERLGVGPEECMARNPALVYGRMTGWGQSGPMAQVAGHDINYLALTGLLHAIGPAEGPPLPPLNLVGDFGGGAMFLAVGLLAGLLEARTSGEGQVVDAAMLDGTALLGSNIHGLLQVGMWRDERGVNLVDGGAPYYGTYETADGRWVAVGAIEPKFYAVLVEALAVEGVDLAAQDEVSTWPETRAKFAAAFRGKTRAEWVEVMRPLEACFSPVLTLGEALEHEQNRSRRLFVPNDGVLQTAPAPRFSRTPGAIRGPAALYGEHTIEALTEWGFEADEVDALRERGAIVQR
jgi:alpha-methylacyl-CoA racemase